MKKFLAVLIGGVVLMGPLSSIGYASDVPDEQWTPIAYPQGDSWRSLYIADGSTLNRVPSVMYGQTQWPDSGYPKMFHCENVDSDACIKYPIISATAFLQPCSDSIVNNCIEDFWAVAPDGTRIEATTPTPFPTRARWDFAGNDAINLPVGGNPAVWTIPGAVNGGGTTQYMAQVFTENFLNKAENVKVTNEQFATTRLTVAVSAVKQIYGRYLPQLAKLSDKAIHAPWAAKPMELQTSDVVIGKTYPAPIVDHAEAREKTLARYAVVKKKTA